jgi:hypothetical protein
VSGSASGKVVTWWEGSYYPDAGELTGWGTLAFDRSGSGSSESVGDRMAAIFAETGQSAGSARDSDRLSHSTPEDSRARAERRVRSTLRRYCAANRLDRLVVLTFREPEFDLRLAQRRSREFIRRRLRRVMGRDIPYVVGWERHKSGAWHVNIATGRYVKHAKLERAWGQGFVWVHKFRSDRGGKDAARQVGRYIAKYVSKDLAGMPSGTHRYEVGQGFRPSVERVYGGSWVSLVGLLEEERGPAEYVWFAPVGSGPPIGFASWGFG